ncbi:HD domain-containing phosphohydrolase [uncultured Desulfosarcina sp.]|uniref:HD domain-containing phosphohydrolase n=1 Tax=uncultured Desulfosarcina sp. TaxID=218289 RepID=UPI0029C7D012|nr:HD domain-containing phosphohydrolase [uncultured Desulfosarcina sp.]
MTDALKETLLFVDDEESILEVASEYFMAKGYHILTAENGRIAVDIIAKEKIDCCFTDINMPEMDGLELAEHIRLVDNTIPVIIMTGYPSLDNTIRTLKNGVVDFLIKPVNLNQLEICVKRVLRERQLFIKNIFLTKEVEGKQRIENLNRELTYKVEELNTLNRIMTDFATIDSSFDLFKRVVDLSTELTHADEACFYVINEAIQRPVQVARSVAGGNGNPQNHPDGSTAEGDDGRYAGSLDISQLILDNCDEDRPLLIHENSKVRGLPEAIRSLMLVPLNIRKKVFGVLAVSSLGGDVRFSEKDLYYMSFMTNKAAYAIENVALYENIYDNLFATLYAFVGAIEARDPYTEQHSNRVTRIAIALCRAMGGSQEEQDILNVAGQLHDIGKIGIRDDILLKPGRLTDEEFRIIKEHPVIGANIVERLGLWDREKNIIKCHHERFDGKGYPNGLAGENIPMLARILSVADVYDAIASDRAYRKRMEETKILEIMYGGSGTQFDAGVIDTFRSLYDQGALKAIIDTSP